MRSWRTKHRPADVDTPSTVGSLSLSPFGLTYFYPTNRRENVNRTSCYDLFDVVELMRRHTETETKAKPNHHTGKSIARVLDTPLSDSGLKESLGQKVEQLPNRTSPRFISSLKQATWAKIAFPPASGSAAHPVLFKNVNISQIGYDSRRPEIVYVRFLTLARAESYAQNLKHLYDIQILEQPPRMVNAFSTPWPSLC